MSYDLEVTWSGAELEMQTTKRVRIIYKPAKIVEIAWDLEEAPPDELRQSKLTTTDLPEGTDAVIEVHRVAAQIVKVGVVGDIAFDEAMRIAVETLNLPNGTELACEIYRKAEGGITSAATDAAQQLAD